MLRATKMCCFSLVIIITISIIYIVIPKGNHNNYNTDNDKSISSSFYYKNSDNSLVDFHNNTNKDIDNRYFEFMRQIESYSLQYNNRSDYEVKKTTIPNSSGSTSPLYGEFKNQNLINFYGVLYSRFGDVYYKYCDFVDFVYISVTYENINAEKYLTREYAIQNEIAVRQLKELRGDDFEFYDPKLTSYEKKDYILIDNKLFYLDHHNRKLIEKNKNDNYDYEQLMIEKDRILNVKD